MAVLWFSLFGVLAVYGLQRLQALLPLNPAGIRRGLARFLVQHRGELHHQHQLAGLRRRDHHELSHPDARAHCAELRLGGDRHGGGCRADPRRSRARIFEDGRQFLGRSHARHALHPAARCPSCSRSCSSRKACRRRSPPTRPCRSSNRSNTTTRSSTPPDSRSRTTNGQSRHREGDAEGAGHRRRPGRLADRDQAARHQRRRLLQRQFGASRSRTRRRCPNFLEMLAILLIPAALCYTFGVMVGDTRQGWAHPRRDDHRLRRTARGVRGGRSKPGNPLLIEARRRPDRDRSRSPAATWRARKSRFGVVNSALWATATTRLRTAR